MLFLTLTLTLILFFPQVTEFWQFFLLRMLTGISVGGAFPIIYSLLGDLWEIQYR